MLKCFHPDAGKTKDNKKSVPVSISSFFDEKPLELNPNIEAGKIEQYVSPFFYAPNVSWLVQRNGMNPRNSLMISLNASEGNHMHANGISMELYGRDMFWLPMPESAFTYTADWIIWNIILNFPVTTRFAWMAFPVTRL